MRHIILVFSVLTCFGCSTKSQGNVQEASTEVSISKVEESTDIQELDQEPDVLEIKEETAENSEEAVKTESEPIEVPSAVQEKVEVVENSDKEKVFDEPVSDPPRPEPEIVEAVEVEEVEPPSAPVVIDHYAYWDAATKKFVTTSGKVNYADWKKEEAKLGAFIGTLGKVNVKGLSKKGQLAYWINLYNAATVKLILNNYPLQKITDLDKPWDQKWISANGKTLSLNDIEHEIIRPQFNDPRIHAAVNCAAVSCPKLLNEAFREKTLDAQLDRNMASWLLKSGKNVLGESKIELSKIFDWYGEDFGNLVSYINKATGKNYPENTPVSFLEYNWSLNKL